MSAAEKLKALDKAASPVEAGWTVSALTHIYGDRGDGVRDILIAQANWRREDADLVVALRNALPQIVAVVEAAELQIELYASDTIPDVRRTLAALDEALT